MDIMMHKRPGCGCHEAQHACKQVHCVKGGPHEAAKQTGITATCENARPSGYSWRQHHLNGLRVPATGCCLT